MTSTGHELWLDSDAGPVVRPYAMTSGRTRPTTGQFDLISIVVATGTRVEGELSPEAIRIVQVCEQPISVAEISAHLDLPAGTVKVLLGDLLDQHLIVTRSPALVAGGPDLSVLEAVLNGIRAL